MEVFKILCVLLVVLFMMSSEARYRIQTHRRLLKWTGCIYKKYSTLPKDNINNTACSECASNGTTLARYKLSDNQRYINCTNECKRPTICTEYKYSNIDGIWSSECYQCEQRNEETISFNLLRMYEICSDECKACAIDADLSTASYCAFKCRGLPTFCFPPEMWFGHQFCYQSPKLYGCEFALKDPKTLSHDCKTCSEAVEFQNAQECAPDCGGMPTYKYTDSQDLLDEFNTSSTYFQCQLRDYGSKILYDIPRYIRKFLHLVDHVQRLPLTVLMSGGENQKRFSIIRH